MVHLACPALPLALLADLASDTSRVVSPPLDKGLIAFVGRDGRDSCLGQPLRLSSLPSLTLLPSMLLGWLVVLFSLSALPFVCRGDAAFDTDIIHKLLNQSGYDWRVRPPGLNLTINGSHGPVVVEVDMLIRSISKIDDVNMEYSVQLTFRESWVDGRLAYYPGMPSLHSQPVPNFVIVPAGEQIWMPDSFFQNEKNAQKHMIDKPNILIRVHKDGTILYSVRISLVLSCPMHLHDYPMDVQECLIDLASYAYTDSDIEYRWKAKDPLQLKDGLESSLPSFQLNGYETTYCTSTTNTGTYSCLRTKLSLKRQFSYYLLQLYIPSTMLVIVSWVSFWLDRSAVPARVTLGVTTLLTMTTQASGINAKLPPVSYTKAIDIWIGGSRTENRSTSLVIQPHHLIIPNNNVEGRVSVGADCGMTEVWVRQEELTDAGQLHLLTNPIGSYSNRLRHSAAFQWIKTKLCVTDKAKRADLLSRVLFPCCFLLFNLAYWSRYSGERTKSKV